MLLLHSNLLTDKFLQLQHHITKLQNCQTFFGCDSHFIFSLVRLKLHDCLRGIRCAEAKLCSTFRIFMLFICSHYVDKYTTVWENVKSFLLFFDLYQNWFRF